MREQLKFFMDGLSLILLFFISMFYIFSWLFLGEDVVSNSEIHSFNMFTTMITLFLIVYLYFQYGSRKKKRITTSLILVLAILFTYLAYIGLVSANNVTVYENELVVNARFITLVASMLVVVFATIQCVKLFRKG